MSNTQQVPRFLIVIAALVCLAAPSLGGVIGESFDSLTAPALPAGWTATNASGAGPLWVSETGANCYGGGGGCLFVDDPSTVSDKQITTPTMLADGSTINFSFQNWYNLENSATAGVAFDGGVFEVSVNAGAYQDVSLMPGFAATSGWYNRTVSVSFSNPLAGRAAWSGDSGTYVLTSGSFSANSTDALQFRFRMGSDSSVSKPGWRIDDVNISGGSEEIPEPSTWLLVCLSLAGLRLWKRQPR